MYHCQRIVWQNMIFLFLTCVVAVVTYWACIVVFEEGPSDNLPPTTTVYHVLSLFVVVYNTPHSVVIVVSSVNFGERLDSSTPIHYRSVRCSGEEDRLTDCPGISTATASCLHTQDVYIVCRASSGRISRKLYQVFCHGITSL